MLQGVDQTRGKEESRNPASSGEAVISTLGEAKLTSLDTTYSNYVFPRADRRFGLFSNTIRRIGIEYYQVFCQFENLNGMMNAASNKKQWKTENRTDTKVVPIRKCNDKISE